MAFIIPIHNRKTKFSDRFNFDDEHPEYGFLQISGEGCVNTKVEITVKMYNPASHADVIHDNENFRFNTSYHETIVAHGMKEN